MTPAPLPHPAAQLLHPWPGTAREAELDVTVTPTPDGWTIGLATPGSGLDLSNLVPVLEAFGLHVVDAVSSTLGHGAHQRVAVAAPQAPPPDDLTRVEAALHATLAGRCPVDGLLRLVTTSGVTWQEVDLLRAYARLLDLLAIGWTRSRVARALVTTPTAAVALLDLVSARLGPAVDDRQAAIVHDALDGIRRDVVALDDDRILADLTQAVEATERTNFFASARTVLLPDGSPIEVLACKFRSADLPHVPAPTPWAEVLVTSPITAGVHLRAGPIARGGLRASDRIDDVRNEVLGLMAAQVVKNSMIVPTGAKGGFVMQPPPVGARSSASIADGYRVYVSGLLAVTDNVVDGDVVGPPGVHRRDGDDPYLVVAADKGTARLSDTANDLARTAGFWLDDAFASGGSTGYDHKALGITARGAWVAIARHFRELDVDIMADPISVVGIGDMSGDVFGNGVLTTPTLRLVGAFDHRDIFLDPDPDPAASFAERRRLFDLPTSSWQDFDRSVISAGGGVWSRDAKQVDLSPRVRDLLRVDEPTLPPDEVIRALLRAQVDLLYAGGIGTVVCASDEVDVDDRANAGIRVTADELRARVVGEGANLAITQRGRIEYARRGGRIDQDAIHNAAGVAISDREVNLKVLAAPLVASGDLTLDERTSVLADATREVVAAVLRDVDAQVWLVSREHGRSPAAIAAHRRHLVRLEDEGLVDRAVDVLPDEAELDARTHAGGGLTRPELATVVAATKRSLVTHLASAPLVGSRAARAVLHDYFAPVADSALADAIPTHRLARQITTLRIASGLVDRLGPTTVHELADDHDVAAADVVTALWAAEHLLDGHDWVRRLQDHAHEVPPPTLEEVASGLWGLQLALGIALLRERLLVDADVDMVLGRLTPTAMAVTRTAQAAAARGPAAARRGRLLDDLVPDDVAVVAATAAMRARLVDVAVLVDQDPSLDVVDAMDALEVADARLRIGDLQAALATHLGDGAWARRHRLGLDRDLALALRAGAAIVCARGGSALSGDDGIMGATRATTAAALAAAQRDEDAADALGTAVAGTRVAMATLA